MLFVIFYIRLVLDAWSLELGAWHLPAGVLGACRLELEAWRLKLGASFSPREAQHNILGGTRSLVLAVRYIFNFRIPAISTIAANISLLCTGTCCVSRYNS